MTIAEHCPLCTRPDTHMTHRHEQAHETVTGWACNRCGHQWQTRYLTAAYGEPDDEPERYDPPDDPEDQPGYWDRVDQVAWDPRHGW